MSSTNNGPSINTHTNFVPVVARTDPTGAVTGLYSQGHLLPSVAAAAVTLAQQNAGKIGVLGILGGLTGNDSTATVATANSDALQLALSASGYVYIPPGLGDIYVNRTSEVYSNTQLIIGAGTSLKRVAPTAFHLLRNVGSQGGVYVNGVSVSGGAFTMTDPGHPWVVGDQVYIEGFLGNTALNGLKTVTTSVRGVSWSFAATGTAPTNTAAQLAFVSRYQPLIGTAFSRDGSGVVTVTEANHGRAVGDRVYVAGIPIVGVTFNGVWEVATVTPGVSWTFAQSGAAEVGTGTAQLLGDHNIQLDVELSGNGENLVGVKQWYAHLSNWGNLSRYKANFRNLKGGAYGRGANFYNVTDVNIPEIHASGIYSAVAVQFDSFCDRCNVGVASANGIADDIVAWGVTSNTGAFGDTTAPTGPGSMGTLTVDVIKGSSPTGLLKLYATTGYDLGKIHVGRITGTGPVSIGDSTAGVAGGSITSLTIDDCDNTPAAAGNQVNLGATAGAFSSMGIIQIGRLVDNATSAATTNYIILNACAYNSLTLDHVIAPVVRTAGTGYGMVMTASGDFKINRMESNVANRLIYVNAGTGTGAFMVSNWTHVGSANSNTAMIYFGASYYAGGVFYKNCRVSTCGGLYGQLDTTARTWYIYLDGIQLNNASQGIGSDSSAGPQIFNIFATNCNGTLMGNKFLQFYQANCVIRFVGKNIQMPVAKWVLLTSTTQYSIDCKEFSIDLGADGGTIPTQLVARAGDFVTNTNATGGGVYAYSVAGVWTKII